MKNHHFAKLPGQKMMDEIDCLFCSHAFKFFVVKTFAIPMLVMLQTAFATLVFFKVKKITFQSLDPFAALIQ
jgi:hypothetical protein